MAYLLLGLPLGTLWFTALVSMIAASVSMLVVALIGIPMLWATWHGVRVFSNFERHTANFLLDRRIPIAPNTGGRGNVWLQLRSMSSQRHRWRELAYLLLRFPTGIATFTIAIVGLTTPVAVAFAPIQARIADHPFGDWALTARLEAAAASPWSWLLVPLGAAMFVPAIHVLNRLADLCGNWTAEWLAPVDAGDETTR